MDFSLRQLPLKTVHLGQEVTFRGVIGLLIFINSNRNDRCKLQRGEERLQPFPNSKKPKLSALPRQRKKRTSRVERASTGSSKPSGILIFFNL